MSKLTFTFQHSFTSTHVLDKEQMEAALKMCQEKEAGGHYADARAKAQNCLLLEAHKVAGLEGFSMEIVRLLTRTTLNEANAEMFNTEFMRVSPVKSVLEITKAK